MAALRTFTIDPRSPGENRWALWFFGVVALLPSRVAARSNGRSRARLVALWLLTTRRPFLRGSRGSHNRTTQRLDRSTVVSICEPREPTVEKDAEGRAEPYATRARHATARWNERQREMEQSHDPKNHSAQRFPLANRGSIVNVRSAADGNESFSGSRSAAPGRRANAR